MQLRFCRRLMTSGFFMMHRENQIQKSIGYTTDVIKQKACKEYNAQQEQRQAD